MPLYDENKKAIEATPSDFAALLDEIAQTAQNPALAKEHSKLTFSLIEKMCKGECAIRDILGFDDQQMDAFYAMGYNFYQAGKYDDANKIFRALCLFDSLVPKHWLGLGATLQMQKQYEQAAEVYGMCATINVEDPRASFHAAECFIALNDREKAIAALNTVVELSSDTPKNKPFIDKAKAMLALLQK